VVYRIVGLIVLAAAAAFVVLLVLALVLLAIYRRTGRLRWPRFAAFAGSMAYSPLCKLFQLFGKPTQVFDLFLIDAANTVMAPAFAGAGPSRVLVAPQCMRAGDCQAVLHPVDGYLCVGCGRCAFGEIFEEAERLSFHVHIVPGDRFAIRLLKKHHADAAVGVACPAELSQALLAACKMGIPSEGVPLHQDGCFETDVDVERVKEAMRRCGVSSKSQG